MGKCCVLLCANLPIFVKLKQDHTCLVEKKPLMNEFLTLCRDFADVNNDFIHGYTAVTAVFASAYGKLLCYRDTGSAGRVK